MPFPCSVYLCCLLLEAQVHMFLWEGERYRSPHRLSDTICIQNSASAMKCSNSLCEHQTLTCMSRQKLLAWALWGRIWGTPQNNTIQLKSDQTWLEFSYEKKKKSQLAKRKRMPKQERGTFVFRRCYFSFALILSVCPSFHPRFSLMQRHKNERLDVCRIYYGAPCN